jgi:hypothetical protein
MYIDTATLTAGQHFLCKNMTCRKRYDVKPRPLTAPAPPPPAPVVQRREISVMDILSETATQVWNENKIEIITGVIRWLITPEKPKPKPKRRRRSG